MATALWQFAEVEVVYERLRPLTPYGRIAIDCRRILADDTELARRYDRIDAMAALLAAAPDAVDRLRHHLKRVPLLPAAMDVVSGADLFLVKKFLVNGKAVANLLGEPARAMFGLAWRSDGLLETLNTGEGGQETFFLADRCSKELEAVRDEIRRLDSALRSIGAAVVDSLRTKHGLDFRHRDFLVIDGQQAGQAGSDEVFLEPFDSRHVIARPVLPKKHFEMLAVRESLVTRERDAESAVLARLVTAVRDQEAVLREYARAIESIDVALAGAELAQVLGMTRPELAASGGMIEIEGGRLVPLEEDCAAQQLEYKPLTVRLDTPHVLLHGSNMSGKSVVLKTVASLQVLAQLGLFVPARRYRSLVFDRMFFIGTSGSEDARGLSSFGREMVDLREALAGRGRTSLFVIDEFARTTNSREAAALIAGLLNFFDSTGGAYSLLATHYAGLPAFDHVRQWRMKGLDWEKLRGRFNSQRADDLCARIRLINGCVPYEMVWDRGDRVSEDALGIAEMLGLDAAIIDYARRRSRDPSAGME